MKLRNRVGLFIWGQVVIMNRKISSVLLVMALASGLALCAGCKKKSNDTEKGKDWEAEASAESVSSEGTEKETAGSQKKTSETTAATTVDLNYSDYEINMAKPPVATNPDGSLKNPPQPERLGYGNFCNGAIATGNSKYQYYVVHPDKHLICIEMESLSTGQCYFIYSAEPEKGNDHELDMLTLYDKYLYFREDQTKIKRIDLTDYSVEDVVEGNITRMIPYEDSLYLGQDSSIVKCDPDGSNPKVLYSAQNKNQDVEISFCVSEDKILFSDPKEEKDDGLLYGKIYSMDLNGKNKTEILPEATASNDKVFFSDGKNLYFFGEMAQTADMKLLTDPDTEIDGINFTTYYDPHKNKEDDYGRILRGFFSVALDGSETTFIQAYPAGSVNVIDGAIFWTAANIIFAVGEDGVICKNYSENHIFDVDDIENREIMLVGDWLFYSYIDPEGNGEGRTMKRHLTTEFAVVMDWPAPPGKQAGKHTHESN